MRAPVLTHRTAIIVMHRDTDSSPSDGGDNLLRFAMCSEPLASMIIGSINDNISCRQNGKNIVAIPRSWPVRLPASSLDIRYYDENLPLFSGAQDELGTPLWFVILNGQFTTRLNYDWLYTVLARLQADVVAVNVLPRLQTFYEKVLVTEQSNVVGFRRFYENPARPAPISNTWPHCLFIKADVLGRILINGDLPLSFPQFLENCSSNLLTVQGLEVGGIVWDLNTEKGLIGLMKTKLKPAAEPVCRLPEEKCVKTGSDVKLFGEIVFGRNISIGSNTVIIGPTIIGDNVKIEDGNVIKASIISPDVSIPSNCLTRNRVILDSRDYFGLSGQDNLAEDVNYDIVSGLGEDINMFRTWPRLSYAGLFKRIADIIAAVIVLVLFVPIMLIIALVIKLTSPGPVFFKDKRQGLHGKIFNCLKFRTMIVGADKIQDKIRALNQVDGPQFRIKDDPRVSTVGRFMRNTYIDEIPQFINVLLGQMSVVGPRPSPELENTLCPSWHDARLSVRPGVTGLWQICRTRQPMKDFQEWIYYDTKYVKNLSLKMDMWIFWQTIKKAFGDFIGQF